MKKVTVSIYLDEEKEMKINQLIDLMNSDLSEIGADSRITLKGYLEGALYRQIREDDELMISK